MKDGYKIYLRLLVYGKPYWAMFSIGVIAMLLFAVTDTGFAFLIKTLTDSFAGTGTAFDTQEIKVMAQTKKNLANIVCIKMILNLNLTSKITL